MRVLYLNHTGKVSGAERSLLEVLRGVAPTISPIVASPDGPLVGAVSEAGVLHIRVPGTDGSLRLHPRHTAVAAWEMGRAALSVAAVARRHDVALVHANSIRAGLIATLGRSFGGPPTVVHIRDRLPPSRVSRMALRAIGEADALVANSTYTAASLRQAGVAQPAHVLGNPVDLLRFDASKVDRNTARAGLGVARSDFVATVLAQITPWKGQEEAIRAVGQARLKHPNVTLVLAGSAKFVSRATRYDNRAYFEGLHRLVSQLGLQDCVKFLGERDDVPALLRASDVLLVPSWEEPFGRSVVEAMALRTPVIATNVGGPSEVITDGKDGLLLPPREPQRWATAICELVESEELRVRLADNGLVRSRAFGLDDHARSLLRIYTQVLRGRRDPALPVGLAPVPEARMRPIGHLASN